MLTKRRTFILRLLIVFIVCAALSGLPQKAITQSTTLALDLMLIIDNSCSMFAPGTPGCGANNALGTDADYLRVTGANIFATKMATGASSSMDRIGIISMGGEANLIYPLSPVKDALSGAIAAVKNPAAQGGTNVIEALKEAYAELDRRVNIGNMPVIVFLTDGVPYPQEGQAFSDIKMLVESHSQVPLYVLLLQNQDIPIPEYNNYIGQWEAFEQYVGNIRVYNITNASELLDVYNDVRQSLIGGSSTPVEPLEPGETKLFYVSQYAKRVEVTAIYPEEFNRGTVEIRDNSQQLLIAGELGVEVFNDPDVPVEVYSAYGPRLAGKTGANWQVTSINARISFFVDVQGAYHFQWLFPATSQGILPGVLVVDDTVNPQSEISLQFCFVDEQSQSILEAQKISGYIELPTGEEIPLDSLHFKPDDQGIYHWTFRATDYSASSLEGRYELYLQGEDPKQQDPIQAIAVQRVWIQVDSSAPLVLLATAIPDTPTASPTPQPTPTTEKTSTPAPTLTPHVYTPVEPPPPDPNQTTFLILLIIVGGLIGSYFLLRFLLKSPQGFVKVIDAAGRPSEPIKTKAKRKIWGWQRLTVGPKGDIRLRPTVVAGTNSPNVGGAYQQPDPVEVNIPGMAGGAVAAPATKKGKQVKNKRKKKNSSIYGYFYMDGQRTKFRYDCQFGKGTRTLSKDTVETIPFGDVQLQMCLDNEKLKN